MSFKKNAHSTEQEKISRDKMKGAGNAQNRVKIRMPGSVLLPQFIRERQ